MYGDVYTYHQSTDMPTIIERNGRYLARVRREGFKPVAKTFTRKTDALAWGRRVEMDMEAGKWKDPSTEAPTFGEALKQYRTAVVPTMKGAGTYLWALDELAAMPMASKCISSITAGDVAAWRDAMSSRGLAAGTVVRRLGLLSGLMSWAHKERGWTAANPVHSVRKPRVNDSRERVLSDAERHWLMLGAQAGRNEWLSDALIVLLESAMRRGELFSITAGDVEALGQGVQVVHLADTKNGSARDVPLTTTAAEALTRLAERAKLEGEAARQRGDKTAPAPGSERLVPVGDAPAMSLAFRRAVRRAVRLYMAHCKDVGSVAVGGFLGGLRLHDLRHTAVTRWASTGALSVHELMAVSGHKTPAMLARYVNLKASDLAVKLQALSA